MLKKNCCDQNLDEGPCIFTFFLSADPGLNRLNGFDFISIYFEWHDTENRQEAISKLDAPLFQDESSCKTFLDLFENELAGGTDFHMNGFALRLVLMQR